MVESLSINKSLQGAHQHRTTFQLTGRKIMATHMHKKYFEILTFVHKLREAGVSEKAAEIQAQAIADVIEQVSNHSTLTKADLANTDRKIEENHRDTRAEINLKISEIKSKIEEFRHDADIKTAEINFKIEKIHHELEVKMAQGFTNVEQGFTKVEQGFTRIQQGFNKVLIWMFSMLTFFSCSLLGVMAKGFHWL